MFHLLRAFHRRHVTSMWPPVSCPVHPPVAVQRKELLPGMPRAGGANMNGGGALSAFVARAIEVHAEIEMIDRNNRALFFQHPRAQVDLLRMLRLTDTQILRPVPIEPPRDPRPIQPSQELGLN